jgi:hypothetical protein
LSVSRARRLKRARENYLFTESLLCAGGAQFRKSSHKSDAATLMERRPSGQKPILGAEVVEIFRRNAGPGLGAGDTTDQFRMVQISRRARGAFPVARRALEKGL